MPVTLLKEEIEAPDAGVEEALEKLRRMGEPDAPKVVIKRVMPDREILQAMMGLGALLAVRLMLLLAVAGAFTLAFLAMGAPDREKIWILGVYSILIVAPLVWLSTKRT